LDRGEDGREQGHDQRQPPSGLRQPERPGKRLASAHVAQDDRAGHVAEGCPDQRAHEAAEQRRALSGHLRSRHHLAEDGLADVDRNRHEDRGPDHPPERLTGPKEGLAQVEWPPRELASQEGQRHDLRFDRYGDHADHRTDAHEEQEHDDAEPLRQLGGWFRPRLHRFAESLDVGEKGFDVIGRGRDERRGEDDRGSDDEQDEQSDVDRCLTDLPRGGDGQVEAAAHERPRAR
jgi:hypothetical protein